MSQPLPRAVVTAGQLMRSPSLLAFGITLFCGLLLVAISAVAYAQLHRDTVFPGVTVHGVPVGGLDRAAAAAELRARLPSLSEGHLTVRFAEVEQRIAYSAFGRDYDLDAMTDRALQIGRPANPVQAAGEQLRVLVDGATVSPLATWDADELARLVGAIAAAAERPPRDAAVVEDGGGYAVQPAVAGQAVDVQLGLEQATAALSVPLAGDTSVSIDAVALPPAVSTATALAAVERHENVAGRAVIVAGGGVSDALMPALLEQWVSLAPEGRGSWAVRIDGAAIRDHVAGYAAAIDREALDATFEFGAHGVTAIAGMTGQRLDVEATSAAIEGALLARAGGAQPTGVNMVVALTEPEVTTAVARDLAVRVVKVAGWTTRFVPGESNFMGQNITIPAKLLDGTVIGPGERFSFLDEVGSFSADKGFGPGGAIIRGRTNPTGAMGGGICSTSTTLFNAALRGGYAIEARTQHSYYIDRYPVGLDATVWRSGGAKRDMVFVNDSRYPIWIRGITKKRSVTFELWSVPDGRTVKLSDPRIEDRTEPDDIIEYTTDLRPGETKRIEHPVAGFKSWVTRVVRDAEGRPLHSDTFYSRYITITGVTQVGIAPGATPPSSEPEPPG